MLFALSSALACLEQNRDRCFRNEKRKNEPPEARLRRQEKLPLPHRKGALLYRSPAAWWHKESSRGRRDRSQVSVSNPGNRPLHYSNRVEQRCTTTRRGEFTRLFFLSSCAKLQGTRSSPDGLSYYFHALPRLSVHLFGKSHFSVTAHTDFSGKRENNCLSPSRNIASTKVTDRLSSVATRRIRTIHYEKRTKFRG